MSERTNFNGMARKTKITIEYARQKLGKKAEQMTDKQIEDLLNLLRVLCNKAISSVVEKNGLN